MVLAYVSYKGMVLVDDDALYSMVVLDSPMGLARSMDTIEDLYKGLLVPIEKEENVG